MSIAQSFFSPVFVIYRADTVISTAQQREFLANKKFTKSLGEVCRGTTEFALMYLLQVMLI